MKLEDLTPEQRAELEQLGEAAADRFEALDPDTATPIPVSDLPPDKALIYAAHRAAILEAQAQTVRREAVLLARAAGLSWHAVAAPFGITAEGARKRYSQAS